MSQHVNRVELLRPVRGAPDEYFLIDSANPKVAGLDGAVRSFVDLLYTLA